MAQHGIEGFRAWTVATVKVAERNAVAEQVERVSEEQM